MRKEFARFCLMYLLFVLDLLINNYIATSAVRELRALRVRTRAFGPRVAGGVQVY